MKTAAAALLSAVVLAACAAPGVRPPAVAGDDRCFGLFVSVDEAVEREGVRDVEASGIAGFPYLRVNRLLSSFRSELDGDDAMRFWLTRLAVLDAEARKIELANLNPKSVALLMREHDVDDGRNLVSTLDHCRSQLLAADSTDPERLTQVRDAAVVPDDYSRALRVLGLYAATRIPFAAGVRAFERRVERVFALPLEALPVHGSVERVAPAHASQIDRAAVATLVSRSADNPLGVPYPDPEALRHLARAHAPVFEIDTVDANDLIGRPYWPPHGPVHIDTTRPVVFYRAAHTRVDGEVLLQLTYTAWFPARPRAGRFDLLGGHLSAVIWRVTLGSDGEPVVFDSMHACGCYHFFFPSPRAHPRPAPNRLTEWLFVPQTLPPQGDHDRVVLRVATRSHYLQRVRLEAGAERGAATYELWPDDMLRSLPTADGGRRSMYGPDGLVAGTERLERFVFWPMGIRSAGAMRQWGRHATAFVGRRHFDDPFLIEQRFELAPGLAFEERL